MLDLRTSTPSTLQSGGFSSISTSVKKSSEARAAELASESKEVKTQSSQSSDYKSNGAGPDDEETVNGLTAEELEIVEELQVRDREVRAHEQAHAAVGGRYAGAPEYTYQKGPDGRNYAIGGEVDIDISEVPNDPEATIDKMQIVRRAALAPAEPSTQDRRVAQQATSKETEARVELLEMQREQAELAAEEADAARDQATVDRQGGEASSDDESSATETGTTGASESEGGSSESTTSQTRNNSKQVSAFLDAQANPQRGGQFSIEV